jgi:hypothetical protein
MTSRVDDAADARADQNEINRRDFLTTSAAVGGAMVVGFWLPPGEAQAQAVPPVPGQSVPAQPWYRDPQVSEINA